MENVKLNLADVPSVRTYSNKIIPTTGIEFQDTLNKLGTTLKAVIRNQKNPSFLKILTGNNEAIHEQLYMLKLKSGASKPNFRTRLKTGRTEANTDYEVTIMPDTKKPTLKVERIENEIDYKFNEDNLIAEFKAYIDSTYDQHYAKDKFQATEFIIDGGHGTGFCVGNVLKYAQRYGKKGTRDDARKDLMKVLHYTLIQLYVHDNEISE